MGEWVESPEVKSLRLAARQLGVLQRCQALAHGLSEKAIERRLTSRRWQVVFPGVVERYQGGEAPAESELESRVFELLGAAGLPRPVKQRAVCAGGRLRRLDFLYEGPKIVIEADGYAYHSDPISFEKDRQRRNSLTSRGYQVLHFTAQALRDRPDELILDLYRTWKARVPS